MDCIIKFGEFQIIITIVNNIKKIVKGNTITVIFKFYLIVK